MTEKIKNMLVDLSIESYLITEISEESEELYFIKKRLDVKRSKNVKKTTLTVYHDHDRDGKMMRGSADVLLFSDMTDEEMKKKIGDGYYAAGFVNNPFYELVSPSGDEAQCEKESLDLGDVASAYARAIYENDTMTDAFVNSAEIFSKKISTRIVNSRGIDVSFVKYRTDGELVVQSKDGDDVEMFDYFSYEGEQCAALSERVKKDLCEVKNRAKAQRILPSGRYDLIIEGVCVRDMLGYYMWKASTGNVYAKYSNAKIGDAFQTKAAKEPLNIVAKATAPYSPEGVRMRDVVIVEDGVLKSYVGPVRFSSYLGVEPTGVYEKLEAKCGEQSLEKLKSKPHLHVVYFSDFQFDPLDGYFGGEIRLGYLYDGEKTSIITGGSVSGNISEVYDSLEFSSERYENYDYTGPLAVKIANVSVSGSAKE